MRIVFAVVSIVLTLSASAQTNLDAGALLQRGRDHYRAGRYAEAASDLSAAAQAYLSSDEMQQYVRTGRFDKVAEFETSLIYLALAQARLGNENEAREAVLRVATAERVAPTFTTLTLGDDAAEFESLAARLVPNLDLRSNVHLAQGATPPPAAAPAPVPQQVTVTADADRVRLVERMVEQECSRIEREAQQKIAAAQRAADERVAAAERSAAERVAAAERAAAERVAEIQRSADARVAAAEAGVRATIAEKPRQPEAEPRRPAVTPVPAPVAPQPPPVRTAERLDRNEWTASLRRAKEFAATGRFAEANEIYRRVATADVPREAIVEAAIGLYRTGAYEGAADAFGRLAPFARGEEDLRYYNAVSLFETGRYREAQHELACALPFIRETEDVIRYRTRIEQMVAWQTALPPVEGVQE